MKRINSRFVRRFFILLLILMVCRCTAYVFLPTSYVFHVPEVDIYVKTKKVWGGKFYVMFSEKKNISFFSNVDYIEMETGFCGVSIMFDKENKKNIAVYAEGKLNKINQEKFSIQCCDSYNDWNDKYRDKNGKLKKTQFSFMSVDTKEYVVCLDGKCLHDGGLLGR